MHCLACPERPTPGRRTCLRTATRGRGGATIESMHAPATGVLSGSLPSIQSIPTPPPHRRPLTMVRSVTFEIRWHDTQPIYSSSFQPIAGSQLKRVLDYNVGQAAGLAPDKTLGHTDDPSAPGPSSSSSGAANARNAPLDIAGGQNWRLATAGGDNNVRVSIAAPLTPLHHAPLNKPPTPRRSGSSSQASPLQLQWQALQRPLRDSPPHPLTLLA